MTFEEFVALDGARLRAGLVAAYGPEVGADAAAEALAWAFEHWDRLVSVDNPSGYLYRVGQSKARHHIRPLGFLPVSAPADLPEFEPGLTPALESLTEPQRVAVILVHALGWTLSEAAGVLDVDVSTVRTHIARAMTKLRSALEVSTDA